MFLETFKELGDRFERWMPNKNNSTTTTNLRLHYLNRAQRQLQLLEPWESQIVVTTLTVSNNQATLLPMIRLIAVGHDVDNDKYVDWSYYKNAAPGKGYSVEETVSKAAGITKILYLHRGWPFTPNLVKYQKILEDYEDSETDEAEGVDVEYLIFPLDLMFQQAKSLHLGDTAPGSKEQIQINVDLDKMIQTYRKAVQQQNTSMKKRPKGINGRPITIDMYTVSGASGRAETPYRNGTDLE